MSGIPTETSGADQFGRQNVADLHSRDNCVGLVQYQERLLQFDTTLRPLLNSDFGVSMNQNVSFSGVADLVTNGGDSAEWTFSNISGTSVAENDDERAIGGLVTIVDYTALSGATITVGVDGADTVKTEGVDWTAATSNDATAASLRTALDTISNITVTVATNAVTVTIDTGFNLSTIDTSDGVNAPATAQAIKGDNMSVSDVFQLDKGSDLIVADHVAFSGFINIDKDWAANDSIEFFCYDTVTATEVSARVKLEDFISFGNFDVWQSFVIPFSLMSITSSTFDAVRFEQAAKDGPKAPIWFLDNLQVEQSGEPLIFTTALGNDEILHVTGLKFSLADTIASTVTDGTMLGLCYRKLLGLDALTNGVILQRTQAREITFAAALRTIGDFLAAGGMIEDAMGDGTETYISIVVTFPEPIILSGQNQDSLTLTIADDLSGLDLFTCSALGKLQL